MKIKTAYNLRSKCMPQVVVIMTRNCKLEQSGNQQTFRQDAARIISADRQTV